MHHLFFIARIYPFCALPLCLILGQLGNHLWRRHRRSQHIFWAAIVFLVVSSLCWFAFRGDLHSDQWVRRLVSDGG